MRVFLRLFIALFLLELLMYGIAAAWHTSHPLIYFPIIPAIWIAMAIGGVHSAGFLSFLIGLTITALLYALVGSVLAAVWRKACRRNGMPGR